MTLTATPADGWRFDHWEVDAFGTKAEVKVSVSRNLFVRAVFVIEPIRYDLSTQVHRLRVDHHQSERERL